jgi:hypothetical protein
VDRWLRRRPLGVEQETRLAGTGDQLAVGAPQDQVVGRELLAHAVQRQAGCGVRRLGQLVGCRAGLVGQVVGQGIERRAPQAQAGVQRAFDLDVEPALDRARDELVRHHVDQHAGHQAHQGEDQRQLDEQPAAELAAAQSRGEAHRHPADDQQQHAGNDHVEHEQAPVVALVQLAVAGRLGEQEHQHDRDGDDHRDADGDRPADRTRAAEGGLRLDRGRQRGAHRPCSTATRWVREALMFQSEWPTAPIWKGRGSCETSSRNWKSTL